uniref:C2H2-type domain-containing protein n=1 Tax=Trichogramma kaykai TaxID=54128 RepID=A0ABD2XPT2_9HYME
MESSGFFNCAHRVKEEPSDEPRVENNREKTEEKSDLRDPRENSSDILQICGVIRESELDGERKTVIEYENVKLDVNSSAVVEESSVEESYSYLDRELNDDVQIVFQDEDVKSEFYSSVVEKIAIHSPTHLQNAIDSHGRSDQSIIKVESMVEVKQDFFDDAEEESNLNPKLELVEQINIDTADDRCITHSCDICGEDLLSKDYLEAHIHSVHRGVSRRCGNCGKIFALLSNLLMHMQGRNENKMMII